MATRKLPFLGNEKFVAESRREAHSERRGTDLGRAGEGQRAAGGESLGDGLPMAPQRMPVTMQGFHPSNGDEKDDERVNRGHDLGTADEG